MTTWSVTKSAERIELDTQGQAEVKFVVANTGPMPEQAVVGVLAGPGADPSWFQVAGDAQRLVQPGTSTELTVQVKVPAATAAGLYTMQGVAHSTGRPEDSSASSGPVTFEVKPVAPAVQPKPKPTRKQRLLVAGAIALVLILALGTLGFFLLRGDDQAAAAPPPPPNTAAPPAEVVVPNVTLVPEEQAKAILEVSGLTVGRVVNGQKRNVKNGTVVDQSVTPGVTVESGRAVDIAVVRNP